ncbi:MAG: hypothetical protein KAR83_07290 [Thermodesulfovibrionales bacterium]|nr:hypothetical protein [Thermodesulfovibrionales bacterium]
MPDFYYADLYFDPEDRGLKDIVDSCVYALQCAGAQFDKVFLVSSSSMQQVSIGEHVQIEARDLGVLAETYLEEHEGKSNFFFSFPPQGRIMFKYDFVLDEYLIEEIRDEEEDTRSSANDLGLTFVYSVTESGGRRVKASLSFWEEYLLTHGSGEVHRKNIERIVALVEAINLNVEPYFGALNSELHLNTDKSHDLLRAGKLPEGNDFVLVGKQLAHLLDMDEVRAQGIKHVVLQNKAVMLELSNKWR